MKDKNDNKMLKYNEPNRHEGINGNYMESDIIIIGIPFDGTVSYRPGTRFAPQAIRTEIDGLETYSPYQDKDLIDYKLCDIGDIVLPFGNTKKSMEIIRSEIGSVLDDEKKIVSIGGEHLITYPILIEYLRRNKKLNLIHIDAHADLRDVYLGEKYSHATVVRRIYDLDNIGEIYQIGIRSGEKKEFEYSKNNTNMYKFNLEKIDEIINSIGTESVYVTIDLDVLDPSIFPGTGTPEPGGVSFCELLDAIVKMKNLDIVGADIVELSPHYDSSGVSTLSAAKILRELILSIV